MGRNQPPFRQLNISLHLGLYGPTCGGLHIYSNFSTTYLGVIIFNFLYQPSMRRSGSYLLPGIFLSVPIIMYKHSKRHSGSYLLPGIFLSMPTMTYVFSPSTSFYVGTCW
jgi:hypothetical protein